MDMRKYIKTEFEENYTIDEEEENYVNLIHVLSQINDKIYDIYKSPISNFLLLILKKYLGLFMRNLEKKMKY